MKKNSEYRDLFPGALEMMILQSLRQKPMHGYALAKQIKQVSEDLLQIEEGSLYPALQRMLKEGWLESEVGVSAKNRPIRIYRLTDAGLKHLEQELSSFEKMFAGIMRVLAANQSRSSLWDGSNKSCPVADATKSLQSRYGSTLKERLMT
jgi:PadR family transcriptional regulator, regulatory protein PadR